MTTGGRVRSICRSDGGAQANYQPDTGARDDDVHVAALPPARVEENVLHVRERAVDADPRQGALLDEDRRRGYREGGTRLR